MDGKDRHGDAKSALARGLGWFSVGLGVAQILAPRGLARTIGLRGGGTHGVVMRIMGLREVAQGLGILARPRPAGWLWSRVAGDVVDLVLLAIADSRRRPRVGAAMAAVAGVTVPDVLESLRLSRDGEPTPEDERGVRVKASTTVRRTRQEVYEHWRNFESFPQFMAHVESVEELGEGRSRWRVKSPTGTVEWEAEIAADVPGETISWRSMPDADVENSGAVRFVDAPLGRGTEVHVDLRYDHLAGGLAAIVAKVVGEDPEQQVKDDLRRFKQLLETGEIVVSDGSPEGQSARRQLLQKAANPKSLAGAAR